MKILLVTGKLTYSNSTSYSLELMRGLLERKHELFLASHGGAFHAQACELIPEALELGPHLYFPYRRIWKIIKDFNPSVIHSTGGNRALRSSIAIARRLHVPLLHSVHSWLADDQIRTLPEEVSAVLVPHEDLRVSLVNDLGVKKNLVNVIPYGIDGFAHAPLPNSADEDNRLVIGLVGRMDRGRRFDLFLDAVQLLHARNPSLLYIIAGEGPDQTRLRNKVRALKLEEVLTFVDPQAKTCELYSVMDILVQIADRGGIGWSLLEGLSHEKPVVATLSGELLSLLRGDEVSAGESAKLTARVVPANDPRALADGIEELVSNPARALEMAKLGREMVLREYPLQAHLIALEEVYGKFESAAGGTANDEFSKDHEPYGHPL